MSLELGKPLLYASPKENRNNKKGSERHKRMRAHGRDLTTGGEGEI